MISTSAASTPSSSPKSYGHSPSPASSTSSTSYSIRPHGRFWLSKCANRSILEETRALGPVLHDILNADLEHMIEKDVHRVGWSSHDTRYGTLHELIRRVTRHLPTYNQSLSFICAFCLDYCDGMGPETVDAAETIILTILFAPPYRLHWLLSPRTSFLQQFVDRFDFLVARVLPSTYVRMTEAGFETIFYAIDWFTTFFTNSLSRECCALVWDVLIVDQLEDALFLSGLAVLRCVEAHISSLSMDELFSSFKSICRERITSQQLRIELQTVVRALVGSDIVPRSASTIGALEKRLADPEDVLVQTPFDATFLMRAVQLDDASRVQLELSKYAFPSQLLDYALYRAVLLGHVSAVTSILGRHSNARIDEGLLSPLRASALLNHPHVLRAILWFSYKRRPVGTKPNKLIRTSDDVLVSEETILVASLLREMKAIKLAYAGMEEETFGGVLDVLEKRLCWGCGSYSHSDPCSLGEFICFPTAQTTCTNCACAFSAKRIKTQCARCRLFFCERCANTFRTVNPEHAALRACETCHHFWGSCACTLNGTFCEHAPVDLISRTTGGAITSKRSGCECEKCLSTFVRVGGKTQLPQDYVRETDQTASHALQEVTLSVRKLGLKPVT